VNFNSGEALAIRQKGYEDPALLCYAAEITLVGMRRVCGKKPMLTYQMKLQRKALRLRYLYLAGVHWSTEDWRPEQATEEWGILLLGNVLEEVI
jgi:hypothetical protein